MFTCKLWLRYSRERALQSLPDPSRCSGRSGSLVVGRGRGGRGGRKRGHDAKVAVDAALLRLRVVGVRVGERQHPFGDLYAPLQLP